MTSTRILVAVSLTEGRDAAFERALAIARTTGAELYLLHAVPATRPFSHRAVERLQRSTELRRRATDAGVTAETFEQHGDPADTILLHAAARHVDLIVMGADRRRGWARWRHRSVADRVLSRTTRPTLVVGPDRADAAGFDAVVAALDAPTAAPLIEQAREWSGEGIRGVSVVHAVTGIEPAAAVYNRARWMVPEFRGHVLHGTRQRMAHGLLRAGSGIDVASQLRVIAGPAADTILAHAEDARADLIVMGRSRRRKPSSTVARVLRHTERSLLIVPTAAALVAPYQSSRAA